MATDPSCTHPATLGRREFLTTTAAGLTGASCASGQRAGTALVAAGGRPGPDRRRPQAPHPAARRRRAQPRPEGGRLREGRRPDRRKDDRRDRRPTSPPPTPRWSTARARSSCPASSPRTITSTRRCSGASSRTAFFRAPGRRRATGRWFRTSGRPAGSPIRRTRPAFIWDLGRVPYDPEDCYISELVACLSEISEGVTTRDRHLAGQSHARAHRRHDQGADGLRPPDGLRLQRRNQPERRGHSRSKFPGAMNDTTKGIGRLAKTYFSSKDQLVTLGFGGGAGPAFPGAPYTGWQLGRSFGALINNHNVGNPMAIVNAAADPRNGTDWSDVTFVHCTRWQDKPVAPDRRRLDPATRTAASRKRGRSAATGARMSRSPTSSRCRCGTGCRRFRRR